MEYTVIRFADIIKLEGPISMLKDRTAAIGTVTGWRNGPTKTS